MIFHFYLKSYGNSDDYSYQKNLCFLWEWKYTYGFDSNGQILVTSDASVLSRCEKLPASSTIYALSVTMLILVIWYQLLLFKAVARQLIIFFNIKRSLDVIEQDLIGQNAKKKSKGSSRSSSSSSSSSPPNTHQRGVSISAPSISGQDLRESITSLLSQHQQQPLLDQNQTGEEEDEEVVDPDEAEVTTELTKLIRSRLSEGSISKGRMSSSQSMSYNPHTKSQSLHERLSLLQNCKLNYYLVSLTQLIFSFFLAHQIPLTNFTSSQSNPQRSGSVDSSASSQQSQLSMLEENLGLLQEAISSLTWEDVFIIINLWFLVATIGNLFAFVYSIR